MCRAAVLLTVLAALTLAACGEDRETGTGTSTTKTGTETAAAPKGKPVRTIEIDESEFRLSPARVTVSKPGVYRFRARNVGNTVHALEVEGQGSEVETKEIQPGESATVNADLKKGEYKLYCPVGNHEQQGMTGKVSVGAKSSGTKGGGAKRGGGTNTDDTPPVPEDKGSESGGYGY